MDAVTLVSEPIGASFTSKRSRYWLPLVIAWLCYRRGAARGTP